MTEQTKPKHHHGNLRAALIEAGIALLEEDGLEGLTLRKCAAKAGVSHAAPAHHFDGLAGLKAAIAAEGFRRFSHFMRHERDQSDGSPQGQLRAISCGYVKFGQAHRALLQVIFGLDVEEAQKHDVGDAGADAYQILRDACAPFVPEGCEPEVIEAQVWSLVHGFTLLYLAGQFGCPVPTQIEDGPFDQVMALLDRIGTPPAP